MCFYVSFCVTVIVSDGWSRSSAQHSSTRERPRQEAPNHSRYVYVCMSLCISVCVLLTQSVSCLSVCCQSVALSNIYIHVYTLALSIGMSANAKSTMRKKCLREGFDGFTAKPFTYDEILQLYQVTLADAEQAALDPSFGVLLAAEEMMSEASSSQNGSRKSD